MPEEFRRLIFSDTEVISAVFSQSRKSKDEIPSGTMKFLTIGGDREPFVRFAIETAEGDKPFKFEGPFLAAALIRFCMDKNIPMPQKSRKVIAAKDLRLIMDIKM